MNQTDAPQTAQEYMTMFRSLAATIEKAIDYAEQHQTNEWSLKLLNANIDTIACLRGDSGMFYEARPEGLEAFQKEMYATESRLAKRVSAIHPKP